jgi:glyoxylase-like metal-dependent hydrolase (beta-lactamase superfamily II)
MLRILAILPLLTAVGATASGNPETVAERSQAAALAVIQRAVEANGGEEAIRAIEALGVRRQGRTWPRLQMPTVAPPYEGGTQMEDLLVDLAGNRLRLEQREEGAGFLSHHTIILAGARSVDYDHRIRTATQIPVGRGSEQQFVQYYRRFPGLLLRQALDRPHTLRYLGTSDHEGRPHDVVTFVMADTQQVALYIDAASSLIAKYELIYLDSIAGYQANEILFGDYHRVGRYQVPRSWRNRLAGEQTSDYRLEIEVNPAITDRTFEASHADYLQVAPEPSPLPRETDQLAEGVHLIRNFAGPNQNTLAVGFADHVVAVEAPGTPDGADAVIARIRELFPGKPIRYIVVTHHHGDHIGGLRSYIAEGATVITTAANRPLIEAVAAAPRRDRLGRDPRKPEFLLVENGHRVLEDATRRLELIDVGPNPHAREMLIAWLPAERVVFQGDLFYFPYNDAPSGPAQDSTLAFADALGKLKLPVDRIAGVHGRIATKKVLQEAVESARR